MDRLANRHRFDPNLLLHFAARYRGNPGTAQLCTALAHVNPSRRIADGAPAYA